MYIYILNDVIVKGEVNKKSYIYERNIRTINHTILYVIFKR